MLPACCTWAIVLIILYRIFWYAVPEWKVKMPAGCRVPIMLLLLQKQKWWHVRERGITKSSLTREEFLSYAWEWKEKYGGIILQQLKKLGCSLDWNRTSFTMDEDYYKAVIKVFIDLYGKGLIYRGKRMVNWDPVSQTALSDEEVIFKDVDSKLYYVSYPLVDGSGNITVATTRPETILGDVAICVNPTDERYASLIGKEVIVPIINRKIPVIADEYVTADFGTGALKITPAHDKNDNMLGLKHNLKAIDTLDATGKFTAVELMEDNHLNWYYHMQVLTVLHCEKKL